MILSSPFSRQNRSHQTWTSGGSANHHHQNNHHHHHHSSSSSHHASGPISKPAPQQAAPQQPKAPNGYLAPVRSHTLNRWDLQQRARSQQPSRQLSAAGPVTGRPVMRNQSSLGHYPTTTGVNGSLRPLNRQQQPIYAPASIASPAELAHYKRPISQANGVGESQHYAATSFRGSQAPSESGRESALGNLFGTLRRHARWSRSSRKKASSVVSSTGSTVVGSPALPPPPPPPPTQLDPDVYATGKREVEAEQIYAEGLRAIDGNSQKRLLQHELDESLMSEGETRTLIEEQSKQQVDYQELVALLTGWINDELSQQRIIVTDLQDDLHDGQVLGKLMERLHRMQLDLVEVTQNETAQRFKIRQVLDTINRVLALQARWAHIRWSVEGIHGKNMVEIIHLLVTLALHYRAPIKLPADVRVQVQVVQKYQGQLVRRYHEAQLTDSEAHVAAELAGANSKPRDAFDTLLEFAPEKLALVKQSLVNFVNRHLNKINISCSSSEPGEVFDPDQFSDGLLLVFLMASLEDYFVPFGNLFTSALPSISPRRADMNNNSNDHDSINTTLKRTALEPTSYVNTQPIHKLHNVNVAFQLMEDAGIEVREKVRAEDIVNGDLKSVLRVLYALFSRYKHL